MPTYCRAHDGLLARATRSVLTQTFSDFEFIVVDDGSVDGSEDVIRDFQKQDDRILYVRHEVNSGLAALRADEGILLGRADYVAVQTDDDEWLRPFLQTVVREAVTGNRPFVHCQVKWLVDDKVYQSPFPVTEPTYLSLIQGNKIGHSSALVHRSVLQAIGLYDPHVILRRWTDWDLWLRVAREITPYMIPEVLVCVYGGLPDSMGLRADQIEYEDFMLLMAQPFRNTCLKSENIGDYDVISLGRYSGALAEHTIVDLYHNIVCPWLTEREKQLVNLGVSLEEATKIRQEICTGSTGAQIVNRIPLEKTDSRGVSTDKDTTLTKKRLSLVTPRIRRLVSKLLTPFPALMGLAQASYRFLWSIPAVCKNLLHPQNDLYDVLPPGFQTIKDDPLMLSYRKRGFVLARSCNLQDVAFLSYRINVEGSSLRAILLSLVVEEPKARGVVAVDVASEKTQIITITRMPVSLIESDKPAEFFFEPPLQPGKYYIRVFSKNLNVPVYILEFSKYRLIRKLFCGLTLDE